VGDTLDGKVISDLRLGRSGLEGTTVAFTTSFTDGTEGVFVVGVGRYSFDGFLAPVANPPALNRVQAGKGIPALQPGRRSRSRDLRCRLSAVDTTQLRFNRSR